MTTLQHGMSASTYVAEEFEAYDLGAPFRVVLRNAVTVTEDRRTREVISYKIPDLDGLLARIVMTRVLNPRKLQGADIKFVRKALGLKQWEFSGKIEVSAEHFSRCETGALPLSPSSEKLMRIFSFKTALKLHKIKACDEKTHLEGVLDSLFDDFKIVPAHDAEDRLRLDFYRLRHDPTTFGPVADDDGHWESKAA